MEEVFFTLICSDNRIKSTILVSRDYKFSLRSVSVNIVERKQVRLFGIAK